MKKMKTAKEYLHDECFDKDLKHSIGQEGILIDEENIIIIMERFADYYHTEKIKERLNDFYDYSTERLSSNIRWEKEEIIKSYLNWMSLENSSLDKHLKKFEQ